MNNGNNLHLKFNTWSGLDSNMNILGCCVTANGKLVLDELTKALVSTMGDLAESCIFSNGDSSVRVTIMENKEQGAVFFFSDANAVEIDRSSMKVFPIHSYADTQPLMGDTIAEFVRNLDKFQSTYDTFSDAEEKEILCDPVDLTYPRVIIRLINAHR